MNDNIKRVNPGDINYLWCSKCGKQTPHVFNPDKTPPLCCLACHPERDPRGQEKSAK